MSGPTSGASEPFIARRERRWHYAMDCVEHIEEHNCAKGCKRGLADPDRFADCGPGGSCGVLAMVAIEEPTTDLWDDGAVIHCLVREPLGTAGSAPHRVTPVVIPEGEHSVYGWRCLGCGDSDEGWLDRDDAKESAKAHLRQPSSSAPRSTDA